MTRFFLVRNPSTVVFVVAFLTLISSAVLAQQTNSATAPVSCAGKKITETYKELLKIKVEINSGKPLTQAQQKATLAEAISACTGQPPSLSENNAYSCNAKSSELSKAAGELTAACATAGLPGNAVDCAQKLEECQGRDALNDEDTIDLDDDRGRRSSSRNSTKRPRPRKVTPSLSASEETFSQCNVFANEDLDEWKKQVEEAEEKVQKLQGDVLKIKEEYTTLEAEGAKALEDIQRAWEDAQETAQKAVDALEGKIQDFDEALAERARKTLEAIRNLYGQIAAVDSQIIAAAAQKDQQRTTLNLKCYEVALAKVAELRAQKQELIKQNLYTAGGFNGLMRSVGLTNLKASETLARDYYSRCVGDMAYKENIRVAENAYNAAVKALNDQIQMLRLQIGEQEKELNRIQNDLQAKGMTNFEKERNQIVTALSKAQARAQRDTVNTRNKYTGLLNAKKKAIEDLEFQLENAEDYLDQKAAYLALKNQYATKSATKSEVAEAFSKNGILQAAVRDVIMACGGESAIPGSPELQRCEEAKKYLGSETTTTCGPTEEILPPPGAAEAGEGSGGGQDDPPAPSGGSAVGN